MSYHQKYDIFDAVLRVYWFRLHYFFVLWGKKLAPVAMKMKRQQTLKMPAVDRRVAFVVVYRMC